MNHEKYRVVLSLATWLMVFLLAACGSDNSKAETDFDSADSGQSSDISSNTDVNSATHWTPDNADWSYNPFPSNVVSDGCESLDSAVLSASEAMPNQGLSISFDCIIDVADLSITIGGETANTLQTTPTVVGIFVPTGVSPGSQTIELSSPYGSTELDVLVEVVPDSPADPTAFLFETIDSQRALAEQLNDPVARQRALAILAKAEAAVEKASASEVEQAADILLANSEGLGLVPKGTCEIADATAEEWWTCFRAKIAANAKIAFWSVLVALAGQHAATGVLGPVGVVAGIIVGGVATGSAVYHLFDIADELLLLSFRVIQVIGADVLNIELQKTTEITSGQPFTVSASAEYVTFSGASMGADASSLRTFLAIIHEAQDLAARVNDVLSTDIEIYSVDEPAKTETLPVNAKYLSVEFAPGKSSAINGTFSGTDVTLTSRAAEPLPVSLIVTYSFPGVRTVERVIDVVVQPSCGSSAELGSVAFWAGCDETRWGVTYAFRPDRDVTCYLDTVFTFRTNGTAHYQDGCGPDREGEWSSTATTITFEGNTSDVTFESQDSVLWNYRSGEFIYRTVRLD